jgi:hypothetical protein
MSEALGPEVPLVQCEWILALLFGYSVEAIERFETRHPFFGGESHVPIVDGSITMATRRELSPDVTHMNNPLWSAVRRVPANLRALVTRLHHFGSSPLRPTRGGGWIVFSISRLGTSDRQSAARRAVSPTVRSRSPRWIGAAPARTRVTIVR